MENLLDKFSFENFFIIIGAISLILAGISYIFILILGFFLEKRVLPLIKDPSSKQNLRRIMFYHRYTIIVTIVAGMRHHWMQWHTWGRNLLEMEKKMPPRLVSYACFALFLLFFSGTLLVLSGVFLDILGLESFQGSFYGLSFKHFGSALIVFLYSYVFFHWRKWKRIIELEKKGKFS